MPIPKLVVTVALTAMQMALTASRKIEGPRLENLEVTVADYGTPLNYFLGTRRFNAVPIIWAEPIREQKKKRKTKGGKFNEYRYFGTWAVAVADHECDAVLRIWFDKHLVYDTTQGGPISAINGRDLKGTMRIYLGTETQEADPRMQSTVEAEFGVGSCPAYRGVTYIVFEEIGLEPFGNRIPQISVEATSNADDQFPYEAVDTDKSNGSDFVISGSGSWLAYWTPDGSEMIEWWDLPSRTLLGYSSSGDLLGEPDMIGLAPDGTAYWMGYRVVGVDLQSVFRSCPPLGATTSTDVDTTYGYGLITRAFGVGSANEVYSTREAQGYFYYGVWQDNPGAARDFFIDQDGQIWGIFQPDSASDEFTLMLMGTPVQYTYTGVTARAGLSAARGCATSYNTLFVVMDATYYSIDRDDMTLLDSGAWSRGTDYDILPYNFPGRATWWTTGLVEFSLLDGSTIRTHASGWGHGQAAHRSIYDPVNHALLIRPQFVDDLIWNFLDRVDGAGVTLGDIVDVVSSRSDIAAGDKDTTDLDQAVLGYSWTQGSGKSIVEPLLDLYDSICRPHNFITEFLKRTGTSTGSLDVGEFARGGSDRYTVTVTQDTDLFRGVALSFADPDADQQPNTATAQRPLDNMDGVRQASLDMTTLVLDKDEAQQLATRWFRRAWNSREQYNLSLTAQQLALEPGDVQTLALDSITRTGELQKLTIRADDVLVCEFKRDFPSLADLDTSLTGAPMDGRRDAVLLIPLESRAFALDIPLLNDIDDNTSPLLYMGAAPYSDDGFWPGALLYQLEGADYDLEVGAVDATSDATWGIATTTLADATHYVWDRGNSVNVVLRNGGTLTAATEAQCDSNPRLNRFALGAEDRWEVIQFTTPTLQGNGSWTLTGLLRGRRGTEWATGLHTSSDTFVMVDQLAPVAMSAGDIGEDLSFKAATNGKDVDSAAPAHVTDYQAASHRPWAPDQLKATLSGGDWTITWKRRSRVAGDFAPDDPPLGESVESYEVYIYRSGFGSPATRTITASSETATYTAAQQVTDGGAVAVGDLDFGVIQVGDLADGYEKQASY